MGLELGTLTVRGLLDLANKSTLVNTAWNKLALEHSWLFIRN